MASALLRKWYVPFVGALLLFLLVHFIYSRSPSGDDFVIELTKPTDETYDVRDGVPLVESALQVDAGDGKATTRRCLMGM
jgi:hypothetical protein